MLIANNNDKRKEILSSFRYYVARATCARVFVCGSRFVARGETRGHWRFNCFGIQ